MKYFLKYCLIGIILLFSPSLYAQKAYFIDGYHGGVWGHYPIGYTSFIVDQLEKHPDWKINLEIEPETWARDLKSDAAGLTALKKFLSDTSVNSRVEYVNPAYGQPYMFNISGETIIRQFSYGIKMLKGHFPSLNFKTYSSEEPCFTSALPQILKSFGYQYASLKNPNTCWGGYMRAHGKEMVNWIGPDGTAILTSPRYAIEDLKPKSTWETIASSNSNTFIKNAFADGIENPIGMTLQDAGWRFGPWLRKDFYKPTEYTTWKNYFENIADKTKATDWKFSQEDVLTSLVWGSQVLQQLAQQTRIAENKIVQAEKIASINKLENNLPYPTSAIDEAWRGLMLAQHHDCWIVPYNGKKGDTWADKVKVWTGRTNAIADSIGARGVGVINGKSFYVKIYNTLGRSRSELVTIKLPNGFSGNEAIAILDNNKKQLTIQALKDSAIVFNANVPAFGYAVYEIKKSERKSTAKSPLVTFDKNGNCLLQNDLYKIVIDKANGGTIKSLVAKTLDGKEFVDAASERKFNEIRGNFYKKGGFKSTTEKPAKISILENGPLVVSVKIESEIAGNPVFQIITLKQGQPLIDLQLQIDWKQNEGIGEFEETKYQDTALRKAFYNDKYKLLTLFPLALKNQKIFKDAPFDVTESKLDNTFFGSWDSIKNNIVLSWVDVMDGEEKYGMTMFTDHTTSYAHGKDFPLGLTTQYSGKGLWGRNYRIEQATKINYQLLPHQGNWQKDGISYQNEQIKEPLQVVSSAVKPSQFAKSLIETSTNALEITSATYDNEDLYIRIFNAAKTATNGKIKMNFVVQKASFVALNGDLINVADLLSTVKGTKEVAVNLKPFGITTLKISRK